MGNCVSLIKKKKEPNKSITLAIVGLDNAGKTTLCSVFTGETPDPDIAPTVGFRNVKFSHSNFDITLFDLGGGKNIRPIWKTYFGEVYGIIYALDSTPTKNLSEAREVFRDTLEHPQVSGKPVLVLANKVDKDDHLSEVDIVHGLTMEETANANNCPSNLVMVSALQGTGNKMDKELGEGLAWLLRKVRAELPELEPRVTKDMDVAKEKRDKEREERRARVQKQREEREKAEELERTRLGITKDTADSDNDDIVGGDPFRALDINTLRAKELKLKEEKKKKKERLQDLEEGDGISESGRIKNRGLTGRSLDDPFKRGLGDSNSNNNSYAALDLFGRGNNMRASNLPPLEPLGSRMNEKKTKKKKKPAYHLEDNEDDEDMFGRNANRDAIGRLGLDMNELDSINKDARDLTPREKKQKKNKVVKSGRIDENEDDSTGYKGLGLRYKNLDSLKSSDHKSKFEDVYPSKKGNKSKKESFPGELERENSLYRNSIRKIAPPNMTNFDEEDEDDDEDEGIEEDSDDASDDSVNKFRSSRLSNNNKKNKNNIKSVSSSKDRFRKRKDSEDDDDDDDDYLEHSVLKDTMRFPGSPRDDGVTTDFRKEMEKLRQRKANDYKSQQKGNDNKAYTMNRFSKYEEDEEEEEEEEDVYNRFSKSKNKNLRNVKSLDEDEDDYKSVRSSNQSDGKRKKKKKNMFRSNKLGPSDDDDVTASHIELNQKNQRFGSPHMVQERGDPFVVTPTKVKNSRLTQFHRNDSTDTIDTKWGLAEELPSVDNNRSVTNMRYPNLDDSDNEIQY